MRLGWYADKYFLRTQEILQGINYNHNIHYQYFPRKDVIVCGTNQVLDIYKNCTGYYSNLSLAKKLFKEMQEIDPYSENFETNYERLCEINTSLHNLWINKVDSLDFWMVAEGSKINNMQPCIGIIGNPKYFAHLETPTLGILAQQSAVATSVNEVCKRLYPNQDLIFMSARFRHFNNQSSDGYAAHIGGAKFVSTDANGEYWKAEGVGTIPHLLIASFRGDTASAAITFDKLIDKNVNRILLVDWNNDCIETSIDCVIRFLSQNYCVTRSNLKDYPNQIKEIIGAGENKIFGVRFDTSGSLIDKSISKNQFNFGVCPELVFKARQVFDELGLNDLKIIVSGGFNLEKIDLFQKLNVPVDIYGIGSSIVNNFNVDFTADAVKLDGKPNAKVGRSLGDWSKMSNLSI